MKTKVLAHPQSIPPLERGDAVMTYASIPPRDRDPDAACKIDGTLNEGRRHRNGKLRLNVWHTPGHTPGS